jgi:hypothetical protein
VNYGTWFVTLCSVVGFYRHFDVKRKMEAILSSETPVNLDQKINCVTVQKTMNHTIYHHQQAAGRFRLKFFHLAACSHVVFYT